MLLTKDEVIRMIKRTVTPTRLHVVHMLRLECIFTADSGVVFILDGRTLGQYIARVFYPSLESESFTIALTDLIEGAPSA